MEEINKELSLLNDFFHMSNETFKTYKHIRCIATSVLYFMNRSICSQIDTYASTVSYCGHRHYSHRLYGCDHMATYVIWPVRNARIYRL